MTDNEGEDKEDSKNHRCFWRTRDNWKEYD